MQTEDDDDDLCRWARQVLAYALAALHAAYALLYALEPDADDMRDNDAELDPFSDGTDDDARHASAQEAWPADSDARHAHCSVD